MIVATARRHRGLTQTELAQAVGVTQNWISEIERGKDRAQIGKILRVLSFLGVRLKVGQAPCVTGRRAVRGKVAPSLLADILAAHKDRKQNRR